MVSFVGRRIFGVEHGKENSLALPPPRLNDLHSSEEFLAAAGCDVTEEQNATKDRIQGRDVLKLLDGMSKLIVAKGKKTFSYNLKKNAPSADELVAAMTGPTGNFAHDTDCRQECRCRLYYRDVRGFAFVIPIDGRPLRRSGRPMFELRRIGI